MKEFMTKNKVVLAVIAVLLVGALLVGVILLSGGAGNNDNTNPTGNSQGTTIGSKPDNETDPSDGSQPSDGTGPSDATDPSENTSPSENTDPSENTEPSTEPTKGETEPPATEPPVTNPPATEPPVTNPPETEPPATNPPETEPPVTEPPATNPPETEPPEVTQPSTYPTEEEGYKGVTPETMNEETTKDWTKEDWTWFKADYWHLMTPQQKYDYVVLSKNGYYYQCGTEGHHCVTPSKHEERLNHVCKWCGENTCDAWVQDDIGRDVYNNTLCKEYDIFSDPSEYCQTCGKHTRSNDYSLTETCNGVIMSGNCYYCDVWVEADGCHTCKAEDVKDEFKHRVW